MSGIMLDKTRPYGEVHGEVPHGLTYEQDGLPFDAYGKLIDALLTTEMRGKVAQRRKAPAAAPPPPQVPDGEPEGGSEAEGASLPPTPPDEVNLEAWVKGQQNYYPFSIFKAAKARYAKNFTSLKQLAEFLVEDAKVVTWDEVAPKYRPAEG
jgi:hypothetical protein